jgi:hypothetical protein
MGAEDWEGVGGDGQGGYGKIDDFAKSPTSALHCILRQFNVRKVRLIPQDLRALNLELFSLPSRGNEITIQKIFFLVPTVLRGNQINE